MNFLIILTATTIVFFKQVSLLLSTKLSGLGSTIPLFQNAIILVHTRALISLPCDVPPELRIRSRTRFLPLLTLFSWHDPTHRVFLSISFKSHHDTSCAEAAVNIIQLRDKLISISPLCTPSAGSFLPGVFKGTDADFNVAFAMGALACANNTGVFIAIQGGLFRPDQVTRNQSSGHFVSVAKANGNT